MEFLTLGGIALGTGLLFAVSTVGAIVYWQGRKFQAYELRVTELQEQLALYAEASVNVARCVDALVNRGESEDVQEHASRRWVLEEAKARLERGSDLNEIAIPLGLSRDEVRLLNLTGGRRPDFVQHSH